MVQTTKGVNLENIFIVLSTKLEFDWNGMKFPLLKSFTWNKVNYYEFKVFVLFYFFALVVFVLFSTKFGPESQSCEYLNSTKAG